MKQLSLIIGASSGFGPDEAGATKQVNDWFASGAH